MIHSSAVAASKAPWLLSLLFAVGGAAGGYHLYEEKKVVDEDLKKAQKELTEIAAKAEKDQKQSEEAIKAEQARMKQKEEEAKHMEQQLLEALGDAQGELSSKDGRLTLQLVDEVLFGFGDAELTENGTKILSKVGKALNDFPQNHIWIQGHTDNVPVAKDNEEFLSNWELSAIRAVNVVHYLEDKVGIDPKRLAAVAFSEHRPVSKTKSASIDA